MAIRLLQQTALAESGSSLGSLTSDHSSNELSATKATTEKTSGRKRHCSTSSSISISSPTKKHCSLSHVGEHSMSYLKPGAVRPSVQSQAECIVLGKQFE